jgi:hypothetical protein
MHLVLLCFKGGDMLAHLGMVFNQVSDRESRQLDSIEELVLYCVLYVVYEPRFP